MTAPHDGGTHLERIRAAIAQGEFLLAYDEASEALRAAPGDPLVRYYAVLALARAGATDRAEEELVRFGMDGPEQRDRSPRLAEDIAALQARIAKDRALALPADRRRAPATRSAELYETIFDRFQRPYACINAATMWLLAGHEARSRDLAKVAFGLAGAVTPDTAEEAYWLAATEAEAALLLGDWSTASDALARGVAVSNPDPAARATTRKQLSLVCEALSIDLVVLAPLRVPPVVHYCGHMIPPPGRIGPFAAEHEPFVAAAISVYLEESRPACAFGSLACGADILFAEALLARGVKLHVVLPFDVDRFKDVSVRQGGPSWIQRFDSCVAGASSVSFATEEGGTDQAPLFDYAARIAMGRAIIQARFLTAEVEQIAVWDGITSSALGGTGSNIDAWQQHHVRHTHVILLPDTPAVYDATIPPAEEPSPLRAMIFADIKGFSRLRDEQLRRFLDDVVRPLGKTLDRFGDDVLYRNSWGDGLYVVLRDVMAAAECAIALQDTMRSLDLEAAGLPRHLGLRIGVHAGPVVEAEDPIRHERNFYGQCVTRTARLEPRTPEGSVYVTDAFAALLALDVDDGVQCQFVGHIPAAKNYGTLPMYSLTRSG